MVWGSWGTFQCWFFWRWLVILHRWRKRAQLTGNQIYCTQGIQTLPAVRLRRAPFKFDSVLDLWPHISPTSRELLINSGSLKLQLWLKPSIGPSLSQNVTDQNWHLGSGLILWLRRSWWSSGTRSNNVKVNVSSMLQTHCSALRINASFIPNLTKGSFNKSWLHRKKFLGRSLSLFLCFSHVCVFSGKPQSRNTFGWLETPLDVCARVCVRR